MSCVVHEANIRGTGAKGPEATIATIPENLGLFQNEKKENIVQGLPAGFGMRLWLCRNCLLPLSRLTHSLRPSTQSLRSSNTTQEPYNPKAVSLADACLKQPSVFA